VYFRLAAARTLKLWAERVAHPSRYLKSPIVELVVGQGEEQTILTAHQAILIASPYFAEAVEKFGESGPVSLAGAFKLVQGFSY
jgi:hypothetical protein